MAARDVAPAAAAAAPADASRPAGSSGVGASRLASGFRRTVLPNGLTVLSDTMPGVRSVAFGAWVRAASIHEPRERMGVSHLLEHMVFKGTEGRSARDIAFALETLGGSLDAYTAREHTSYQARVLDEHLGVAADVIADLVFRPALRSADLKLERQVVLEEISMVDDTPDDLVFELHNEALWGTHPYGYSILGTRDTVSALGVSELRELHRRAYHPPQLVVAAAGNVDHDRLLGVLETTGWAAVPRGVEAPLAAPAPVALPPAQRHVEREGAQTHLVFGSPTVSHNDTRRYAVVLVSTLLGGGMSSRLFQRVREELGLAYAVYTFQSFHADVGMHGVYVGTSPGTAERAADAVREELARVAAGEIPEDEIAAGKQQLRGQVTLSLESVSSRMYRAAGVELYGEPFRTLDDILAEIDRVTPDAVAEVARRFFDPTAQTLVSLGPAA
ncbi:MAG TPA: pitrilysin family protein [Gemmatimonadaceae bacterium]|nr:pitrilysin family protein [Gemmatimonadaceae bacterium]